MVKRVDLNEAPAARMARLLRGAQESVDTVQTRPPGIKDLGVRGDVRWQVPDGPSWVTWSVKDIPPIVETLGDDLEAAAATIAEARAALDAMQGRLDTVNLDLDGLNGQIDGLAQAAADAAAAATAAETAANRAAQDAADALEAAQNASGKKQVYFGTTPPSVGDPGVLWIDGDGRPHQWQGTPPDTGEWVLITDARIVAAAAQAQTAADVAAAAQAAAQAAGNSAQAAQAAAEAAADSAAQALTSAAGRNSRIISLTPATGTVHPQTGNALVVGDTWWQWDNTNDRNVVAAWVWDATAWRTETLADSVLGSLDVNKLLVLGTARMTEAVVQKIMGDAAFFNAIKVEDLTVTGDAILNEAVAAKIAAAQIVFGVLRSEVDEATQLYSIFDSFGLRVIDNDGPEGDPVPVIQLGPSGSNLLQLGDPSTGMATIDSSGGVTAVHGSFETLFVGGRRVGVDTHTRPLGEVASAVLYGGFSRKMIGRGVVLGLDVMLDPGRRYLLSTNSPVVHNEKAECQPQLELQITLDGSEPESNWAGNKRGESSIGWYPDWRNLPPMYHWVDLRGLAAGGPQVRLRAAVSLANRANNGWCMVAAPTGGHPLQMWVEDRGILSENRGHPFFDAGGGGQQAPRQQHTRRWYPTGWTNYIRGGSRDYGEKPTQGQWSNWNRSCYFFFDDMTAELAGAQILRIILFSWADHWANATGTGRWHWHGMYGSIPESGQASTFMIDIAGWPRGSARTLDLIPEDFAGWQSGERRGFGFTTWDTSHEYYGQFSPLLSAHFIEVTYLK